MVSHKIIILVALPVFCALSLQLKENYPFSHFPMYGNPTPVSQYYHLTDGEGKPLPIATLTGKTAPKLGKMLRSYRDERMKEIKPKVKDLSKEDWALVCQKVLDYLRQQAAVKHMQLPAKMKIMSTEIRYADGKVVETPEVFFAEP
ncbi:MAG: hypothetical protein JWO08_876 [Verrucomicrobiaceae bacterium]|nr:hypothetical protein [Verrucomicrobiaceae bacterium]